MTVDIANFSRPFSLATTIVHGAATVPAFSEPARTDETIRDLAHRIFVREDAEATAKLPALRPAEVTVTLKDGRVLEAHTVTNRGDTADTHTPVGVRQKFFDLAVPVWGQPHAEAVMATVDALPQQSISPRSTPCRPLRKSPGPD